MSTAYAGFFFAVAVLLIFIDSIYSLVALDGGSFNALVQFSIFREAQVDLLFLSFTFPVPNGAWFSAIGDIVTANQGVWNGVFNWVRIFVFLGLGAALIWPLLVSLFTAILFGRRT